MFGPGVQLRSAVQAFVQTLDLFGKPTKAFYAALAPFARDAEQRARLELLGRLKLSFCDFVSVVVPVPISTLKKNENENPSILLKQ